MGEWWRHFVRGMARCLDLGGQLNEPMLPHADDTEALRADWNAVGEDMRKAAHLISDVVVSFPVERKAEDA